MISKELLKTLNKQFGEGKVVRGRDAVALSYERIPTGSMQFDIALGGGIPLGRVIEFAGYESHGKTTMLLKIIAENQRLGKSCAFIDTEGSFDFPYAETCGIDLNELQFNKPLSLEEMIDLTEVLVASREIQIIAIDSITGPVPLHVQSRSADEPTIGVEAKLNNLFCRKIVTAMAPGDLRKEENRPWCVVLYTNQLRQGIGQYAMDAPGGGMGLKFFKSISVYFRRTAWLNEDGKPITATTDEKWGQSISFIAKKNKTSIPHGNGEVDFYFRDASVGVKAGGFDLLKELVLTSIAKGVIEQRGAYFYIGEKGFQGRDALVSALRTDREVYDELVAELQQTGVPFLYYKPERRYREVRSENGSSVDATE